MKHGRAPPTTYQHREADHEHHGHADAGRHETGDAEHQSEYVTTIEWTVVVSENEVRESADERTDESDLERPDDVLVPGPNSTNSEAAAVAIHGPTPARRMTTRSRQAAVKCKPIVIN